MENNSAILSYTVSKQKPCDYPPWKLIVTSFSLTWKSAFGNRLRTGHTSVSNLCLVVSNYYAYGRILQWGGTITSMCLGHATAVWRHYDRSSNPVLLLNDRKIAENDIKHQIEQRMYPPKIVNTDGSVQNFCLSGFLLWSLVK